MPANTESTPQWWTPSMPELVAKRDSMPGVDRLQTLYCRYRRASEATAAPPHGWERAQSHKHYKRGPRLSEGVTLPPDHPYFSDAAPHSITMRITDAPAEFAVPVKQDRRLAPSFKVKVEVRYRRHVSIALTLKAHLISQQDKDNILSWLPLPDDEDGDEKSSKLMGLKGSTTVTHLFEAGTQDGMHDTEPPTPESMARQHRMGGASNSTTATMPLMHAHSLNPGASGVGPVTAVHTTGLMSLSAPSLQQNAALAGLGHISEVNSPAAIAAMKLGAPAGLGHSGLGGGLLNAGGMLGTQLLGAVNLPLMAMVPTDHHQQQIMALQRAAQQHQQQQHQHQQQTYQLAAQLGANVTLLGTSSNASAMQNTSASNELLHRLPQSMQSQHQHDGGASGHSLSTNQQAEDDAPLETLEAEYTFMNLEFLKATRMSRVYMVFAATILDVDTLFLVYHVPTIGICRAEQREKACHKLGVPMPMSIYEQAQYPYHQQQQQLAAAAAANAKTGMDGRTTPDKLGAANSREQLPRVGGYGGQDGMGAQHQGARPGGHNGNSGTLPAPGNSTQPSPRKREAGHQLNPESEDSDGFQPIMGLAGAVPGSAANQGGPLITLGDVDMTAGPPRTRQAMREWILDEYESTGLTRRLTQLDLQALLSQAGFPMDTTNEHVTVSVTQWDEFCAQFRSVLNLLRQISGVWNLEDPCVISGFDMDRVGTVQALAAEPVGTFVCRFSMSQPGCLVLSCKTAAEMGNPDNLLHAIIKIDDLYERRIDTWIRDFVGATHVLDVYRQKRVDKRKVFASNYTRLRGLEMPPASESVLSQ